ncbi:MAG TPA: hypothetical protein VF006_13750 [Longimicrobium sp.]
MLAFLGLLGVLWMGPACETGFCMCVRNDVGTEFASSDAVFTGRVVAFGDTAVYPAAHSGRQMRQVTLRVDRAWKGVESHTMVVFTEMDEAACGFRFRRGGSYLVFAGAAEDGTLVTGLCDRTSRLWRAAADLRALGPPARRWPR